jgi:putative redox protein
MQVRHARPALDAPFRIRHLREKIHDAALNHRKTQTEQSKPQTPMITTHQKQPRYLVQFSNGKQEACSDAPIAKGGQGAGFGPHELLEASLACCINMWIRMQADKQGISVDSINVSVTLKREHPEEAIFEYTVRLDPALPPDQGAELLRLADACPVQKTLLKKLSFQRLKA